MGISSFTTAQVHLQMYSTLTCKILRFINNIQCPSLAGMDKDLSYLGDCHLSMETHLRCYIGAHGTFHMHSLEVGMVYHIYSNSSRGYYNFGCSSVQLLIEGGSYSRAATINFVRACAPLRIYKH